VATAASEDVLCFGLFDLDLRAGQLRKNGARVRLSQQPIQVLALLLERPGEVVTRDELRQRLWPGDVFVDFDHGLNKSIQKIREALGDSAESPRYIETVPRTGYRFIAPVHGASLNGSVKTLDPAAKVGVATPKMAAVIASQEKPRGHSAGLWSLLAASVVLVAGAWWLLERHAPVVGPIRSLAVLPLDNLSGDPVQNYFADGMTDELTTMLAKNSTLRIVSRTSVMQYKGAHRPMREIAQALGVDGVLEGSIARHDDKVHMTIQLIQGPSDSHVWAESYDRDANDVVSLPREAALAIAKRLNSATTPATNARYVNPEAHDAYLRGRYQWFVGSNEEAGKEFRRAVELQPDYALGWVGLALYYGQGSLEELRPEEATPQMEATAKKAVELDDTLPEAHLVMAANYFFHRWDWARADQELSRAIELNPSFAEAYHLRSKMYGVLNREDEAIASEEKAMEINPFERPFAMSHAYMVARRYDEDIADARQRLKSSPNDLSLHWMLWEAYRRKGDGKNAAIEFEKLMLLWHDTAKAEAIRSAYEKGGYRAVALWNLSDYRKQAKLHYVSPVAIATVTAQLGQRAETLDLLEQGYGERSPSLLFIQTDPAFDFLHGEPRYRKLIQEMGLPPIY
jgi:TolB-like protein